ncbi:MAG TPA: hypothetical protein VEF89_25750 [Solirubrobacteraceae bacterium]|nr:hypothetical protein [Solirubrobacteraceae bacterium]
MNIQHLHASKFGNGAIVAAGFREQMVAKGRAKAAQQRAVALGDECWLVSGSVLMNPVPREGFMTEWPVSGT